MPEDYRATVQTQFLAQLALEKGNPNYEHIKRDFNRFGFKIDLSSADASGAQRLTDLGHLNEWRNKAAHQGNQPLGGGVSIELTIAVVRKWQTSCEGLAVSLDEVMRAELHRILGTTPW